jgi:hypothetical protein
MKNTLKASFSVVAIEVLIFNLSFTRKNESGSLSN